MTLAQLWHKSYSKENEVFFYFVKMFEANIPVFTISGNLYGLTIISIDVHTSSIFIIFMVLSMLFLFITRRSYYYYYDKTYGCHCSTSKKICGNGCHWDCKRRSHNYNCAVCWVLRTYCQPCQLSQIIWLSLDCQGHTMSSWLHFELSKG